MIKSLLKSKVWIFILVIVFIFVPAKLTSPAETDLRSVILAIGIDKLEDQYQVSYQILIPHYSSGFNETTSIVSAVGENLFEATQKITLHLGKISGFGHASTLIFGESMKDENIIQTLDFFLRSKRVNNNALVITTNHDAKTLLENLPKIDNSFTLTANSIIQTNKMSLFATELTMEEIMADYYKPCKSSIICSIDTFEDDNSGINSSSISNSQGSSSGAESSSSSSSSSSGGDTEQYPNVSNEGRSAIYKNGKQVAKWESDDLIGYNAFTSAYKGLITLKNVTDEKYTNADVVISLLSTVQNTTLSFSKSGTPRLTSHLKYMIKVNQIIQDGYNLDLLRGADTYVTTGIVKKFKEFMKTHTASFVNKTKELNADILNVYDKFYKFKTKEWNDYLDTLSDKSNYYQGVEFYLEIDVTGNL